jgi:GDPmannose 4,6-dehydratase
MESIADATLNLLEVLRYLDMPVKFYNAGSSECFGEIRQGEMSKELSPFRPKSPYAAAKAASFWITANYREAYGLFSCSGILFNHESPLRSKRFVTKKIVSTAVEIASGRTDVKLKLGNLDIWRDWGYAPDYVEAMWLILQQDKAEDYVIATGKSHSLQEFIDHVFIMLNLNWKKHVSINKEFIRPADIKYSCGNPKKAEIKLGWKPTTNFEEMIRKLVEFETKVQTINTLCHV